MIKKNNLLFFVLLLSFNLYAKDLYVALNGSDQNEGSKRHPFASLEHARKTVQDLHTYGYKKTITVFLRKGSYSIGHSFVLTSQDSGFYNNPVIYTAYKKEKVSLSGGISVPLTAITAISDSNILKCFKPSAREHIAQVNLKSLGINDFGEIQATGYGSPFVPLWMELFVNKKPFQLARWPNKGFVTLGKVIEKGAKNTEYNKPLAQFIYTESAPSTWKYSKDMWISGYLNAGWAQEMKKIDSIDIQHKIIKLSQSTLYGLSSGKPYERWFAENIIEELDTTEEYYVDRSKGILYFYSQQPVRSLELSMQTEPIMMIMGSSNIKFKNITFECTRGLGIWMEHSNNNRIENCQFLNIGLNAVCIGKGIGPFSITYPYLPIMKTESSYNNDGGENNGIINCAIYNIGAGGVILGGGDRRTLSRGNNFIKNCTFHDFNRINRTYKPAINLQGVGNYISHCNIYDAPCQAIMLNGNDQTIEYNNIYNVLYEVNDNGAIYYGRDPTERGHTIKFNYFHHIGNENSTSTSCVYVDDGSCGTNIYGNIFYKIFKFGIIIGGGSYCPITNNLFVECKTAVSIDNRLNTWESNLLKPNDEFDQKLKAIKFNFPPYSIRYPEISNYWQLKPQNPQNNIVSKNIFYDCSQIISGNKDWLSFTDDNYITNQHSKSKKTGDAKLSTTDQKLIKMLIKGLRPIDFYKIKRE